jgi:arylsulfatase A-like enzyme
MYEESLAMPLVARWPGVIKPGNTVVDLTQNIDFAPTFLDVARAPIPEDMHGESLLPLFKGSLPQNWRKSIYYHYYEEGEHNVPKHEGVRTERYKLIHFYGKKVWELYDLKEDPQELKNVYDNPDYLKRRENLKKELKRLKRQYSVEEKHPPIPL